MRQLHRQLTIDLRVRKNSKAKRHWWWLPPHYFPIIQGLLVDFEISPALHYPLKQGLRQLKWLIRVAVGEYQAIQASSYP